MSTSENPRVVKLRAARQKDSETKRAAVLEALESMKASGVRITFAAVAKAADVSNWLVYEPAMKEHIQAARQWQQEHGIQADPAAVPRSARVSGESLRVDLELARQQIRELREANGKLTERLRLQLGTEMGLTDSGDLVTRVDELVRENQTLQGNLAQAEADKTTLKTRVEELEDDLNASRAAFRKTMVQRNTGT